MDRYEEFILDQIQGLRKESKEEPIDKNKCDYAISFLLKSLVEYRNTVQA